MKSEKKYQEAKQIRRKKKKRIIQKKQPKITKH